jgi:hypothetical protein
MSVIKHIAGNFVNGKQECIMCGEILCDYTHMMSPAGTPAPKGWPVGKIYKSHGNPTITSTIAPKDGKYSSCCN